MRKENIYDPAVIEQVIVSRSVIRQADKLPAELVEYHRNVLTGMGLIAELVAGLPIEYWLNILEEVQRRHYGE